MLQEFYLYGFHREKQLPVYIAQQHFCGCLLIIYIVALKRYFQSVNIHIQRWCLILFCFHIFLFY